MQFREEDRCILFSGGGGGEMGDEVGEFSARSVFFSFLGFRVGFGVGGVEGSVGMGTVWKNVEF